MKGTTSARFAGSAWELARLALLLSAAARLAGAQIPRLVPLLLPLAAPGLALAGGFAASAMLATTGDRLLPLLRMGKLLEAISGVAALAAAFFAGALVEPGLVGLIAVATIGDVAFFLLLVLSEPRSPRGSAGTAEPPRP